MNGNCSGSSFRRKPESRRSMPWTPTFVGVTNIFRRFLFGLLLILGFCGIVFSSFAQDDSSKTVNYLVSVKAHHYRFQQIGTFTYFVCAKKDSSDDCQKIQALNLQANVDWDGLKRKAKKASLKNPDGTLALETFVDQYGGPWEIKMRIANASDASQDSLKPFHADILAPFGAIRFLNLRPAIFCRPRRF